MHRFDSGRRLPPGGSTREEAARPGAARSPAARTSPRRRGLHALLAGLALTACSDPPDPPATPAPRDLPRWSTAPHVLWASLGDASTRPLAVFVAEPASAWDRVASDDQVTTFLNDRFQPYWLTPQAAPDLPRGAFFLDRDGCALGPLLAEAEVPAWVSAANDIMLQLAAPSSAVKLVWPEAHRFGVDLAAWPDHPLRLRCRPSGAPGP